jgi:hypothetical protein
METDDVDEDGFTVVKKGKGKKYWNIFFIDNSFFLF